MQGQQHWLWYNRQIPSPIGTFSFYRSGLMEPGDSEQTHSTAGQRGRPKPHPGLQEMTSAKPAAQGWIILSNKAGQIQGKTVDDGHNSWQPRQKRPSDVCLCVSVQKTLRTGGHNTCCEREKGPLSGSWKTKNGEKNGNEYLCARKETKRLCFHMV